MKSDSDLVANSHEHDLMTSATVNDSSSISQRTFPTVLSSIVSTMHEQSGYSICDSNNEHLNDVEERYSVVSSGDLLIQTENFITLIKNLHVENEKLKMKQAVDNEKDERLELYKTLATKLQEESNEKEEHLNVCKALITKLQEDCNEKDKQLAMMSKKLAEKEHLIEHLETRCVEKNDQLIEKDEQLETILNTVSELQVECSNKNAQLAEKTNIVQQLQSACDEKDDKMKATLDILKNFGNNIHEREKLYEALIDSWKKCSAQDQWTEALVHLDNAIELEKEIQCRSTELAFLFVNKAYCYSKLKQYQKSIDATTSALYYEPDNKFAWFNRAVIYFNLKNYSNAQQDLEKTLGLDPEDDDAHKLLKQVQERINAASFQ